MSSKSSINPRNSKIFVFGDDTGEVVRRILGLAEKSCVDTLLGEKDTVLDDYGSDLLTSALECFWQTFAEEFPEMTTCDSELSGEDRGTMATWLYGSRAGYPAQNLLLPLPRSIEPMRVFEATQKALIASGPILFEREVTEIPEIVFAQMYSCACHLLHHNVKDFVDQTDGWFDVLIYESEENWNNFRASEVNAGIRTLKEAVALARSNVLSNCFEVVVSAEGDHVEFERGERVFYRHHHEPPAEQIAA